MSTPQIPYAVNALLNYYEQIARQYNIDVKFRIALPDELDISVSDLCSILGNLIENAIDGCKTAEEGERYCYLSVVATAESRAFHKQS